MGNVGCDAGFWILDGCAEMSLGIIYDYTYSHKARCFARSAFITLNRLSEKEFDVPCDDPRRLF